MGVINYFKKASGISFVYKNKAYLMLFLVFIVGSLRTFCYPTDRVSIQNAPDIVLQNLLADKNKQVLNIQNLTGYYESLERQKQILINRVEVAEKLVVLQKRNYQRFGLGSFILIFGFIGFLFYTHKRLIKGQRQKENELKVALNKIETENIIQEQHLSISRELYATIGAKLAFIISSLDNLKYSFDIKDETLKSKLDTISHFASVSIDELRDAIWSMNKNEITIEDIEGRILNYIEKTHVYDAHIQFDFKIEERLTQAKHFSITEGLGIYYVLQEAIQNSAHYAKASKIRVEVLQVLSNIVFKISDNGEGFDKNDKKRGDKIQRMQKRIDRIGGKITISSILNKGTEISITIWNNKN